MRSALFIKRTFPKIALSLSLAYTPNVASAGILNSFLNSAKNYINKVKGNDVSSSSGSSISPSDSFSASNSDNTVVAEDPFSIEKHFISLAVEEVNELIKSSYSNSLRTTARLEAEKVSYVKSEGHVEVIPEYSENGLTFKIRYDEQALKDPQTLVRDIAVLKLAIASGINSFNIESSNIVTGSLSPGLKKEIESPHALAELITNVRMGSPTAKARWVKIQSLILAQAQLNDFFSKNLNFSSQFLSDQKAELDLQLPKLEEEAVKFSRRQQKALEQWRSETGALDKLEAQQDKLDDLILKNDRVGVRRMLEAYLPWAVMEPVEANTWKIWLDAIENPDPAKMTVAFRGLKYDTDKIQRQKTSKGEIFGFMSTVLTKNQGSYTRRLRSLSTNRLKNGDIGIAQNNSEIPSIKVTDQMTAHARNPQASSFISFTYDPNVAFRFMGQDQQKMIQGEKVTVPYGGILVVKMDSRRMIPNVPSMFASEIELLAPLVVFPDEVVVYKEGSFKDSFTFKMFTEEISKKTGIDFTSWSNAKDANDMTLKARYLNEGHAFLQQMVEVGNQNRSCSKVF